MEEGVKLSNTVERYALGGSCRLYGNPAFRTGALCKARLAAQIA